MLKLCQYRVTKWQQPISSPLKQLTWWAHLHYILSPQLLRDRPSEQDVFFVDGQSRLHTNSSTLLESLSCFLFQLWVCLMSGITLWWPSYIAQRWCLCCQSKLRDISSQDSVANMSDALYSPSQHIPSSFSPMTAVQGLQCTVKHSLASHACWCLPFDRCRGPWSGEWISWHTQWHTSCLAFYLYDYSIKPAKYCSSPWIFWQTCALLLNLSSLGENVSKQRWFQMIIVNDDCSFANYSWNYNYRHRWTYIVHFHPNLL